MDVEAHIDLTVRALLFKHKQVDEAVKSASRSL
jgi:hypothetical protein